MDHELESMVSDSSGCDAISQRISNELWAHVNYPYTEYSRAYVEAFALYFDAECGIRCPLKFESVQHPREYNFATDRIFAHISRDTVRKLYKAVNKATLDAVIKDTFTSYDGFISHYAPSRKEWGTVDKWDHNQLGCILAAFIRDNFAKEWESNIVEDWSGNGYISNWMYDGLDPEGKRLVKIADYLRARQERQYR
ncbi:MAG: hypothetical protein WAN50_00170 [Minisyncoccia bacterium]